MPIKLRSIALIAALLFLGVDASGVCVDWASSGRFADIEETDVIFEGAVERIEPDTSSVCGPDRVVFKVRRVWKGAQQAHYVLLQVTDRTHDLVLPDGRRGVEGCPMWVEQDTFHVGRSYIVFASGPADHLESMGCGLSRSPSTNTRRRLDAWKTQTPRSIR